MDIQYIAVFLILFCVAVIIVRHAYRQATGKNRGCNCGSCPRNGGECHCHDTHK